MPRRALLTLSSACSLFGLYMLYASLVGRMIAAPSINGPHNPRGSHRPNGPIESIAQARAHLGSNSWAANAKYKIRTANAFVYFEQWTPDDSDKGVRSKPFGVRFKPFAVIWIQQGKQEDEAPLVISSESAYIKFASKFDFTDPNPGRIIGGALEGSVRITGPDALAIKGRNFHFTEESMRIWSGDSVEFAYGPHTGSAHGFQVKLIADEVARRDEKLAASGIESIQLLQRVKMNLVSEDRKRQPIDVKLQSAGSFEFVVETNNATFENRVSVRSHRRNQPAEFNQLTCDLLTLDFEPNAAEPDPAKRPSDADPTHKAGEIDANPGPAAKALRASMGPVTNGERSSGRFQGLEADLSLQRMHAWGPKVVLTSKANELRARMTDLVYDAHTKVAVMTGRNSVYVTQRTSEMSSPEITLMYDEDESTISSVLCRGSGWLEYYDAETQKIAFSARWSKQLRKYPDRHSDLDILEIKQQVLLRQPEQQMGLAGEFIKVWIDRKISRTAKGTNSKPANRFRLRRLLALKDVAMVSPEMNAETQRLEVWVEEGLPRQTATAEPVRLFSPRRETTDAHPRPNSGSEAKPNNPIEVSADLIRVQIVQGPQQQEPERQETQVAQIWNLGNVEVKQRHQPGQQPLRMTGDQLHVVNRNEHDQLLHVYGKPAHIRGRRMHIEGRELHLDRAGNVAWVTGPGLLELPVERTLEGEELEESQLLDIWWKEQMRFDGRTAHFFGDVRSVLNNNRTQSQMSCQEMQVFLTKKYSFSEEIPQGDADDEIEIDHVVCKEGVEFKSKEYEANRLVSIRQGRFVEFLLNPLTGKTEAQGPGLITSWRRGEGKRPALSPFTTVKANKPLQPNIADWEYTQIGFSGTMSGRMSRRFRRTAKQRSDTQMDATRQFTALRNRVVFRSRVEIVYGPVERPLETIEADDPPKDGGWMRCRTLTLTQHRKNETSTAYVELFASGNAEFAGRSFSGQADTISYDESKNLFILRSLGSQPASIWRQTQIGGDPSKFNAQRMEFIPPNQLKFDRTTGLEGLR